MTNHCNICKKDFFGDVPPTDFAGHKWYIDCSRKMFNLPAIKNMDEFYQYHLFG